MFRPRFLIWLLVGLGNGALTFGVARAQTNSLFPSRSQRQPAPSGTPAHRAPPPPRPDTVSLPYHLLWGDTQDRLAALFAGVGAKITNKKQEEANLEVWAVQGLIAPNLQASEFTFRNKQLAALEFDYGQPDWDLPKYNDMMGQFRRLLDAKCEKPGEMISRESDQTTAAGVKQSLMGYQWSRGDTLVQLFYFAAEDPAKALTFRSISVHYHYQDPSPSPALDDSELPTNANADPNVSPLFGGRAKPPALAAATPPPAPAPTPVNLASASCPPPRQPCPPRRPTPPWRRSRRSSRRTPFRWSVPRRVIRRTRPPLRAPAGTAKKRRPGRRPTRKPCLCPKGRLPRDQTDRSDESAPALSSSSAGGGVGRAIFQTTKPEQAVPTSSTTPPAR